MNRKLHADSLNYCCSNKTLIFAGQYTPVSKLWHTTSVILVCFDLKNRLEWKDCGEIENGLEGIFIFKCI